MASDLLALALVLSACGTALSPAPITSPTRAVPFVEVASSQSSRYGDDNAAIMVGATGAGAASIVGLVAQASAAPGRVLVAAFEGGQRTGGYGIRVDTVERAGDQLIVRATFTTPAPGSIVTQVLTSPVHVVSIAQSDATGAREAVLLDGSGVERARTTIR